MRKEFSGETLARLWRHQLFPLIEEYFFDQPDLAAGFNVDRYWPGVTNT
jgi:hypothetical protein